MDRYLTYSRINQGGSADFTGLGFGGTRQQVTRVTRTVYVNNESPSDLLPILEQFLPRRKSVQDDFSPLLPTSEPPMRTQPFYYNEESPSGVDSSMRTQQLYHDQYRSPPPTSYTAVPPPVMNQPNYYSVDSSMNPNRYGPVGRNPVNQYMMPEEAPYPPPGGPQMAPPPVWANQQPTENYQIGGGKYNPQVQGGVNNGGGNHMPVPDQQERYPGYGDQQERYPGYGDYNSQIGGGQYNPQVQGGNKIGGNGKISMGPELNGGNVTIRGGNAKGGNVSGWNKKKKKGRYSSDEENE